MLGTVVTGKRELVSYSREVCHSPFFSPGTMRFWGSRLDKVYPAEAQGATYFVTSELSAPHPGAPRRYTVRKIAGCNIKTIGEHFGYRTAADARRAARDLAQGGLGGALAGAGTVTVGALVGLGIILGGGAIALAAMRAKRGAYKPNLTDLQNFIVGLAEKSPDFTSSPLWMHRAQLIQFAKDQSLPLTAEAIASETKLPVSEKWPGTDIPVFTYIKGILLDRQNFPEEEPSA